MTRHYARDADSSSEFNSSRGYNHAGRNGTRDYEESDGSRAAYGRARGDYGADNDPNGDDLWRAMCNTDRRESRGGSAARARGGGRGGGRGGAHGRAHENPYHGVEAFPTDDEDSDPEHAPRGATRVHRRRGEGVRGEEAHLGSRWGHGGGGRVDPRDARFSHSHHHHGYDERAGQDLDDDDDVDDSDDARIRARRRRRILDESSEEDGDSDDARRIEEYRAAAGHGDRYGGPSRRY